MKKNNVIPTEQFKAVSELVDFITRLENNRRHFTAILDRGPGSGCYATVVNELRHINHEVGVWIAHLPK